MSHIVIDESMNILNVISVVNSVTIVKDYIQRGMRMVNSTVKNLKLSNTIYSLD